MGETALDPGEGGAGSPAALELTEIVKHWPRTPPVLEGVTLRLDPGTGAAIAGSNGAGKTTLLRIAAGLISPESGGVRVHGLDPERERTAFQRRIGFLSAGNSGLYARLSAERHLELWARLALLPKAERRAAIQRTVAAFALEPLLAKRVDRLSMGQRQRLRVSLAFLHDPDVVLLDEPGTSLDAEGLAIVESAIAKLVARGGAALVCVPTGWERPAALGSGYVLSDGRLVAE